jgi:hypothetical protein
MIDDLKKQAAPKAAELVEITTQQNKKLDTLIILLSRLCDLHEDHSGNSILVELLDEHKRRSVNDLLWRNNWRKTKHMSITVGVIATTLTAAAFYFNVVQLDRESAVVEAVAVLFGTLGGLL